MIGTRTEIEQQGFAILPAMFSQHEMENLAREIEQSGLKRSKAGIRHALQNSGIRNLAAEQRLFSLAREVLGQEQSLFAQPCLINRHKQTGWSCGTKTPLCPFGSGMTFQAGGLGQ